MGRAGGMNDDRQHWEYLDKIFSDNYKKEIDQEENVWRTLPFFSATIAFELAAMVQLRDRLLDLVGIAFIASSCAASAFCVAVALMLWYLWGSIRPRQLFYIAPETAILEFTEKLAQDLAGIGRPTAEQSAFIREALQTHVLEQWAQGASKNRQVNKLRAQLRTRAARMLLLSIVMVLTLMIVAVVGRHGKLTEERLHAEVSRTPPPPFKKPDDISKIPSAGAKSDLTCYRIFPGIPKDAGCNDRLDL